jgi:type VI protein secretion system component VasK
MKKKIALVVAGVVLFVVVVLDVILFSSAIPYALGALLAWLVNITFVLILLSPIWVPVLIVYLVIRRKRRRTQQEPLIDSSTESKAGKPLADDVGL